ncbi:MAG: hypothetical protein WC614_04390 [bacterium]
MQKSNNIYINEKQRTKKATTESAENNKKIKRKRQASQETNIQLSCPAEAGFRFAPDKLE